jgi:Leucine-rich repeat (LRR) protein
MNAGNIPHELSQLSNLQGLYLQNNNLSGKEFPLSCLVVDVNAGNIPNELSKLSNLLRLNLSNNNLSGKHTSNCVA